MTSGTVKTLMIHGQSAGLLPNSVIIGNGRVSTTERMLVINEGLINLRLLKIQSGPFRNTGDFIGRDECFYSRVDTDKC